MLVNDADILILDEPMTGLDPKSSHDLKQLLKEHTKNGNTVFLNELRDSVLEKYSSDELVKALEKELVEIEKKNGYYFGAFFHINSLSRSFYRFDKLTLCNYSQYKIFYAEKT